MGYNSPVALHYIIPPGVEQVEINGHPALTTTQGGAVAFDAQMLTLWQQAGGKSIEEVLAWSAAQRIDPILARAGLACLAESGFLLRSQPDSRAHSLREASGPLVSVVLVGFNSKEWLEACLASLHKQTYSPIEIVLVDNGSSDGTEAWVREHNPEVRFYRQDESHSLAFSINTGVAQSGGQYFLILNPDVCLEPEAVAELVSAASRTGQCAAAAAKLKLMYAPRFLNGMGNFAGAFVWGTDYGLGQIDLGQLDDLQDLHSACFAAALIPRKAWEAVGPLDEGFPLYYEDIEWCYRARLLGFHILAAPGAVVYHAFGGKSPQAKDPLSPEKRRNVVYGRLRFAAKLTRGWMRTRLLASYCLDDLLRSILALLKGSRGDVRATWEGWTGFRREWKIIQLSHRHVYTLRASPPEKVFRLPARMPFPFVWRGIPELNWYLVCHHYLPLLLPGKGVRAPEFAEVDISHLPSPLKKLPGWNKSGVRHKLRYAGRRLQFWLARF